METRPCHSELSSDSTYVFSSEIASSRPAAAARTRFPRNDMGHWQLCLSSTHYMEHPRLLPFGKLRVNSAALPQTEGDPLPSQ